MKNKQTKIIVISIAIISILCIVGFSYAFFAAKIIGNDKAEEMKVSAGTMELTFTDNPYVGLEGYAKPGDSISKTFTVENTGTIEDEFNYNIKLVELNTTFLQKDLTYNLVEYEDGTYEIPKEGGTNVTGFINTNTVTNKDSEGKGDMYLAVDILRPTKGLKHYYKLTITFEELDKPQNYNQGAVFNAKVNIDSEGGALLYDTLQEHPFYTYMMSNREEVAKDDPDGNIRYAGANPNNYIWFNCNDYSLVTDAASAAEQNCEKWRIIGLMKNITLANGGGEQDLVKIIRDEPLNIDLSWDGDNYTETNTNLQSWNNDWSTSELMYLLNEGYDSHKAKTYSSRTEESANNSLYWNSGKGKCYTSSTTLTECNFSTTGIKQEGSTKNMIEEVKWNLGGLSNTSSAESYYGTATTSKWYQYERLAEVYTEHQTEWNGKIGLMYPSDYGYATSGGSKTRQTCLNTVLYSWNSNSECYNNDWLFNSNYQWTLTPRSVYSNGVFRVDSGGSVTDYFADFPFSVRPSLYLKSSVKIKSGEETGGAEAPYILVP